MGENCRWVEVGRGVEVRNGEAGSMRLCNFTVGGGGAKRRWRSEKTVAAF